MTDLDVSRLRELYDTQLRAYDAEVPGNVVDRDGPLRRTTGPASGYVVYRDLEGIEGDALDALIARQVAHFAERGQEFEWKLHGHDRPDDLPERLTAQGLVAQERETVVIGPVAPLAAALPVIPDGIRLREVSERADLDRIGEMEREVWGTDSTRLIDSLEQEIIANATLLTVVVAEDAATNQVVSAGWVRFVPGTSFATLWGGSTLPAYRGRGIYRALVSYRARLAGANGYTLLQVDASDDSKPILERLGFVAVTTTTPYVYHP